MIEIINVQEFAGGIDIAVNYIHSKWGSEANYPFYYDAILNSSKANKPLPKFYLLLKDNEIIGCYGLIINDFISRHDLFPWFACLYIEEIERGNSYGRLLLEHAEQESLKSGFYILYIATDLEGYYEKYEWKRIEDGYNLNGYKTRIYKKNISNVTFTSQ